MVLHRARRAGRPEPGRGVRAAAAGGDGRRACRWSSRTRRRWSRWPAARPWSPPGDDPAALARALAEAVDPTGAGGADRGRSGAGRPLLVVRGRARAVAALLHPGDMRARRDGQWRRRAYAVQRRGRRGIRREDVPPPSRQQEPTRVRTRAPRARRCDGRPRRSRWSWTVRRRTDLGAWTPRRPTSRSPASAPTPNGSAGWRRGRRSCPDRPRSRTGRPGWPGSRPACRWSSSRSARTCCTRRTTRCRCGRGGRSW